MKVEQIHNAVAADSFEPWIAAVLSPWLAGFEAGFSKFNLSGTVSFLNIPGNEESDETI
jgi:hypothetical protein